MDFDLLSDLLTEEPQTSTQLLPKITHSQLTDHSYPPQNEEHDPPALAENHDYVDDPMILDSAKSERSDAQISSPSLYQTGLAITKIEDMIEAMTDCILGNRKQLTIRLKSRRPHGTKSGSGVSGMKPETRGVSFPNSSPREAWKFSTLLRILELTHEALVTGNIVTKRDMYYRDPGLFSEQSVVDRYVDDVARTFGLKRDTLNVVAAAKGLVSGSFLILRKDGQIIDFSLVADSQLVPTVKDIDSIELLDVTWILVIEKEATYRTLAMNEYWKASAAGKGILITAKGYPDIQSRQFLHFLSETHPKVPILSLVDFDPDGIGIMSTYKYGSMNLAHENEDLSVPSMEWLGLRSRDMVEGGEANEGLLQLTKRDRRVATRMLGRGICGESSEEKDWRRELQIMLMMNRKAEIQILGNGDALQRWLDGKLEDCLRRRIK